MRPVASDRSDSLRGRAKTAASDGSSTNVRTSVRQQHQGRRSARLDRARMEKAAQGSHQSALFGLGPVAQALVAAVVGLVIAYFVA